MNSNHIIIKKQKFILHQSGALFWKEKDLLLIADVHLGKISHFRKYGMAVPQAAIARNFEQLDTVINHFNPKVICFLGDLFHSYINAEWHYFEQWVNMQSIELALIMGNHDVISRDRFEKLGVKTYEVLHMGTIFLTHHTETVTDKFNIAGHIHPSVQLKGSGKQRMKLSCFFTSQTGMILPAFGDFTGTHSLTPKKGDRVFAIVDDEVIELN